MSKGHFAFVLHSHLPYVLSHGRWPHGTDWLNEAAAETYLPILRILEELITEGYQPKLTIGFSPVLCEQLSDNSFKEEFVGYLNQKIKAAQHDSEEFYKYAGIARRIIKYHDIVPSSILKDLAENNPYGRTREMAKDVLERRGDPAISPHIRIPK